MPDSLLMAHEAAPYIFDIGGQVSPISIRDQMVRGCMLVDRAVREKLIDDGAFRLLVVGAGVGGATAAIRAAQSGVETWLIDPKRAPFARQRGCWTRMVDPVQYDWPVEHWDRSGYPWTKPDVPLPWSTGLAATLATLWTTRLNIWRSKYPNLIVHYNTDWTSFTHVGHFVRVQLSGPKLPYGFTRDFGMVLMRTGFGTEDCDVGNYSGFKFWDTDPCGDPDLGVKVGKPVVLISGGGDGALQDFLRIVTRFNSAKRIYSELTPRTGIGEEPDWAEVEAVVQSAEDQAQRAHLWGQKGKLDHDVLDVLHQVYESEVRKLLDNTPVGDNVRDKLGRIIRAYIPELTFAHRCTHFSRCYGLNQFLVLLLIEYLKGLSNCPITVLDSTEVTSVTGVGHACNNNARVCHGQDHKVDFRYRDCFGEGQAILASDYADDMDDDMDSDVYAKHYNVLIIRHGVTPPQQIPGTSPLQYPRQMLPYHLSS